MLFGLLSIVVGCLSGLLAIASPLSLLAQSAMGAPTAPPADFRSVLLGAGLFGAAAALFIVCGVGSIRIRRWVRPLMLSVGWTWLLVGLFTLVRWLLLVPEMRSLLAAADPQVADLPEGSLRMIVLLASGVLLVGFVALPAAFIWFYQDRAVERTLDRWDPVPRWTDRCPPSVLTLSLSLYAVGVLSIGGLAYGVYPFFGYLMTGTLGWAGTVATAVGFGWLGRETYRMRPIGWWGTVLATVILTASSAVTVLRVAPKDLYGQAGIPAESIALAAPYAGAGQGMTAALVVALGAASIAYLLWIRRHFRAR